MFQITLTPAAGKRLIARAIAKKEDVKKALDSGTLVIIAGTTNACVAEEILKSIDQEAGFSGKYFFRGVTLPPGMQVSETGRLPDESVFPGDVVIIKGKWHKGKTVFDVAADLREGDVILKGANAVDLDKKKAAVLIGHPQGGTIVPSVQALIGRRVRLILPVGLEKRVHGDVDDLAAILNKQGAKGSRLYPVCGEVFTELDAVSVLSGGNATARLVAAGGVCGAEGSVLLAVCGEAKALKSVMSIIDTVKNEPAFLL